MKLQKEPSFGEMDPSLTTQDSFRVCQIAMIPKTASRLAKVKTKAGLILLVIKKHLLSANTQDSMNQGMSYSMKVILGEKTRCGQRLEISANRKA